MGEEGAPDVDAVPLVIELDLGEVRDAVRELDDGVLQGVDWRHESEGGVSLRDVEQEEARRKLTHRTGS